VYIIQPIIPKGQDIVNNLATSTHNTGNKIFKYCKINKLILGIVSKIVLNIFTSPLRLGYI